MPYYNFEDIELRQTVTEDPKAFLKTIPEGAMLDEIQRVPDLPSYIQVLVDEPKFTGLFVLTGSQNFRIRDTLSQSLAGRTAMLTLLPLSLTELDGKLTAEQAMFQGFYPRIYDKDLPPRRVYADYLATNSKRVAFPT